MIGYLAKVEDAIEKIRWLIKKESIEIEAPEASSLGYIKGVLEFIDDSKLIFSEIISPKKRNYRFHYMDRDNRLIKRWDSVPHYRKIKTFPFHLHTPSGINESSPVSLPEILETIASEIINKNSLS